MERKYRGITQAESQILDVDSSIVSFPAANFTERDIEEFIIHYSPEIIENYFTKVKTPQEGDYVSYKSGSKIYIILEETEDKFLIFTIDTGVSYWINKEKAIRLRDKCVSKLSDYIKEKAIWYYNHFLEFQSELKNIPNKFDMKKFIDDQAEKEKILEEKYIFIGIFEMPDFENEKNETTTQFDLF